MVTLGHHAQAITGGALRKGQHELLGERRGDGLRQHVQRLGRTRLTDEGQEEGRGVEATQLIQFGEREGVLRLDHHEAAADLDHAELAAAGFVFAHFVGHDGFKALAAA